MIIFSKQPFFKSPRKKFMWGIFSTLPCCEEKKLRLKELPYAAKSLPSFYEINILCWIIFAHSNKYAILKNYSSLKKICLSHFIMSDIPCASSVSTSIVVHQEMKKYPIVMMCPFCGITVKTLVLRKAGCWYFIGRIFCCSCFKCDLMEHSCPSCNQYLGSHR